MVQFTRPITHQTHHVQSGRSKGSALDIFNAEYLLTSQSENKKLRVSVWIAFKLWQNQFHQIALLSLKYVILDEYFEKAKRIFPILLVQSFLRVRAIFH